jgi:hypothetical protein
MDKPETIPSYDRLKELLAIPERQRTEAQWDEINELEITLTPVNRVVATERMIRRPAPATADQSKPREHAQGKRPLKNLHKRPKPGIA